jgi:hypothetical protein
MVRSPTQPDRIFCYYQVNPHSLIYSLPGQPHLCGDVTNTTRQDILVPSGKPTTHSLTHLPHLWWHLGRIFWYHQVNPPLTHLYTYLTYGDIRAGYSGTIRSTLIHSRSKYQTNLACVVTSPTQPGRIFWYHQFNLLSLTYSLPGVWWRHQQSQVGFYGTIGDPSLTQLLTTRLTSSVWWCNGPSRARYPCPVIRSILPHFLLTTRPTSPVWWRHQLSRAG